MSIYGIALMTFVLFLSTQVGVPVLPAFSAQLGADETRMAAILSSALMTIVALQFFSGLVADRWGRKRVLVLGAALGGLSSLLCAVAPNWQALLGLRILGGVADALAMPALLALTAEIAAGRQGAFFGILRSSQGLSFIVAPAIGGWLALYGLRLPFLVDGALSFVACGILYLAVHDGARVRVEHGRAQWRELGKLLQERRVYVYALFGLVDNLSFPVVASFLPIKAQQLGFGPGGISLLLVCNAIAFTLACGVIGPLSDRWGRKPFVFAAQPVLILACLGLAASRSLPALIGCYTLFGAAGATTFLLSTVMMADHTPPEHAAARLGAFDALIDLGILAGPPMALGLHSAIGTIEPVLIAAALPALVAWPVAWAIRETRAARPLAAQT